MASDEEFLDADSITREGDTRREVLEDTLGHIDDELYFLRNALADHDLAKARRHFKEVEGWIEALDDDLCERDEDGFRKDGE